MRLRHLSLIALLIPGLGSCAAQGPGDGPAANGFGVDSREGIVSVYSDGALFTEYRHQGLRVPSLYPLYGPGDVPVTRAWPMEERDGEEHDHPHHTSVWLAHGDVNGHDFWHGRENRIVNAEAILCTSGRDICTIRARNHWIAGDHPVLFEDRSMTFWVEPNRRVVDFDIRLSPASGEVTFGDTKEGTFAIRMHPQLRLRGKVAEGVARNSQGVEGSDIWGKPARWVAYSAPVEGHPITVVLMDHPRNLRHPTWWHARDYGLCAANPFGARAFEGGQTDAGDFVLRPHEVLRLRYRIVLFKGSMDAAAIEHEWEDFSS